MILGITGKIASGKSEVMKVLSKNGFYCVYADKIVHELYKSGGEGAKKIEKVFGNEFIKNQSVNRKKLRDFVFNDPKQLEILNETIHPFVIKEIKSILDKHKTKHVAIESIYFDPNFFKKIIDKIILINRAKEEIMKILVQKRGFLNYLAEKTINFFKKPYRIDYVIENNKNLSALKISVMDIVKSL